MERAGWCGDDRVAQTSVCGFPEVLGWIRLPACPDSAAFVRGAARPVTRTVASAIRLGFAMEGHRLKSVLLKSHAQDLFIAHRGVIYLTPRAGRRSQRR